MLKSVMKHGPALLTNIFEEIRDTETTPADLKTGLLSKLAKKGDLSDCNQWHSLDSPEGRAITENVMSHYKQYHNKI